MRKGLLFIISAPSGTGKTTLVERLVQTVPDLAMSRSYTSRPPRSEEIDGINYNFVDEARFLEMVNENRFLEWETIFGFRYGTSTVDTEQLRLKGLDVVLVIDVQGTQNVIANYADTIGIFIIPPSFNVLEERLRGRSGSSLSEDALQQRLNAAKKEVDSLESYRYVVVNDDVEKCVDQLRSIVIAERLRTTEKKHETVQIIDSFNVGS